MADRNFGVFAFTHAALTAGHNVVTRLTGPRFRSLSRQATRCGPREWAVNWTPTADEPLWLPTTSAANANAVAAIYRRWLDVETDIRDVKMTLGLNEVRARGVGMVRKEEMLGMVAYNVVVQTRRLAASRGGAATVEFCGGLEFGEGVIVESVVADKRGVVGAVGSGVAGGRCSGSCRSVRDEATNARRTPAAENTR